MSVAHMIENRPFWMAHPSLVVIAKALEENKANEVYPSNWAELARVLGMSKQSISHWRYVPAEGGYVLACEQLFGIPRHKIRPDIYPDPTVPSFRVAKTGAKVAEKKRA